MYEIYSNVVDIQKREIFPACVKIDCGIIHSINKCDGEFDSYIMPGFVDAHVHIESSMVTPYEFSREAVKHGTVGTVSDPHEIANVLGIEGVTFMIDSARRSPMKFTFGAPSCVPATTFESSGASIKADEVDKLFDIPEITFLSEVMNFPGVIYGEESLLKKLHSAKKRGYPVDGHAPAVSGHDLRKYADEGITTDHECFSYNEGKEKIAVGMKILIREGSAAKNFNSLIPLLKDYPEQIMFCSDDLHPDDLLKGHINVLVKRALKLGYDIFDVLRASSYNVIKHYNLNVGMLQQNDPADFLMVNNLEDFNVIATYIDGKAVFSDGYQSLKPIKESPLNIFNANYIEKKDLQILFKTDYMKVIEAIEGELVTRKLMLKVKEENGLVAIDKRNDILKIVVQNRYKGSNPALGLIKGFNLKHGALCSSISHDSHNIVCVGTDDQLIIETMNWIIDHKGGIAYHDGKTIHGAALAIAGIISGETVKEVANSYANITNEAIKNGTTLKAPLMTLAFMSLLVIPELKLSDQGLFDVNAFEFTSLYDE
ncbi:MAG TPA: adenine deaminase [Bacteroidales bacterium]|nr:adenine deaminase [Bacteroidales bacterium]